MLNKIDGRRVIVAVENTINFNFDNSKNILLEKLNPLKCVYVRTNNEVCGLQSEFISNDKLY